MLIVFYAGTAFPDARPSRIKKEGLHKIPTKEAKAIIEKILRQSEFRDPTSIYYEEKEEDPKSLNAFLREKKEAFFTYLYEKIGKDLDRWAKKIKDFFDRKKKRERPRTFTDFISRYSMVILTIFVILLSLAIVYFFIKLKKKGSPEEKALPSFSLVTSEKINPTDYSSDEWHDMAQKYSLSGDYLLAVRAAYLSLLSFLHRQRIIIYDKNKTNWEYYLILKKRDGIVHPFQKIIIQYEKNWYGKTPCDKEDYLLCHENIYMIKQKIAEQYDKSS